MPLAVCRDHPEQVVRPGRHCPLCREEAAGPKRRPHPPQDWQPQSRYRPDVDELIARVTDGR